MKLSVGLLALAFGGAAAFAPAPKAFTPSSLNVYTGTNLGNNEVVTKQSTSAPKTPTSSPGGALSNKKASMKDIWKTSSPIIVQGGSLKTWSFADPSIDRVLVMLKSEGRPLHANVELWCGPDNTPQKMEVYNENGNLRPFSAIVETPRAGNAMAVYNTGQIEFPLSACVEADVNDGLGAITKTLASGGVPKTMQGGSVYTKPFEPAVSSVQCQLRTDGRPLTARIELLQGPNNSKQVINLYSEDGMERPFFVIFETPGSGNVVRIVNTATVEFPLYATLEPYQISEGSDNFNVAGGSGYFMMN